MNEVMSTIMERTSIRCFQQRQIEADCLEEIIQAGLWAPNAGSRQAAKVVVIQNEEINEKLGQINRQIFGPARNHAQNGGETSQVSIADDSSIKSAFYGAPTVIAIFAPDNYPNAVQDCVVAAENMILAAWSMGIGSCYVARGERTFQSDLGKTLTEKWGITEEYQCHVLLPMGYPDGKVGKRNPRKDGRVIFEK